MLDLAGWKLVTFYKQGLSHESVECAPCQILIILQRDIMLRTSHHVKYRLCLLPVVCRYFSIQAPSLNKTSTISNDADVCIISRSSLRKKKSKRRKEPITPIPLSQRLRDASIKKELTAGGWDTLPKDVSYKRKEIRANFCHHYLTYHLRCAATKSCGSSNACSWFRKGLAQVKLTYAKRFIRSVLICSIVLECIFWETPKPKSTTLHPI